MRIKLIGVASLDRSLPLIWLFTGNLLVLSKISEDQYARDTAAVQVDELVQAQHLEGCPHKRNTVLLCALTTVPPPGEMPW